MFNWNIPNNQFTQIAIFLLVLWEAFWKIFGLWKSAKKGDKLWFIAIFVVNLFGLVPLFYLWKTKQLNTVLQDSRQFIKRQRFFQGSGNTPQRLDIGVFNILMHIEKILYHNPYYALQRINSC